MTRIGADLRALAALGHARRGELLSAADAFDAAFADFHARPRRIDAAVLNQAQDAAIKVWAQCLDLQGQERGNNRNRERFIRQQHIPLLGVRLNDPHGAGIEVTHQALRRFQARP